MGATCATLCTLQTPVPHCAHDRVRGMAGAYAVVPRPLTSLRKATQLPRNWTNHLPTTGTPGGCRWRLRCARTRRAPCSGAVLNLIAGQSAGVEQQSNHDLRPRRARGQSGLLITVTETSVGARGTLLTRLSASALARAQNRCRANGGDNGVDRLSRGAVAPAGASPQNCAHWPIGGSRHVAGTKTAGNCGGRERRERRGTR
jgi:hypothetical protein